MSVTQAKDEWKFEFHTGTITTTRVRKEIEQGAKDDLASVVLRLVLTKPEAKIVEESASHQNAVRNREVPDGSNVAEDNTGNNRQTVGVQVPPRLLVRIGGSRLGDHRIGTGGTEPIPIGDYRVASWETDRRNDDFQVVTLNLLYAGN